MNDPFSPYDELKKQVNDLNDKISKLTNEFKMLQASLDKHRASFLSFSDAQIATNAENINMHKGQEKINKKLIKIVTKVEKRLEPENPGDINHLYQNWEKH